MAGNSRRFAMNSIAETLREFSERFEVEDSMHINSLPDELLLRIFHYVELEDRVDWVSRVCTRWERLCRDASLWRHVELEYEPGCHAFRKQMLDLAPCLKSLRLVLPAGRDVAFQASELHPIPADIQRLSVALAPSTVPLMLKALEKVLRHVRELELVVHVKHCKDHARRRCEDRDHAHRYLDVHRPAYGTDGLAARLLPECHVRRLWDLLGESQLESLVVRGGWPVGLLERRRDVRSRTHGPLAPNLRNLLFLSSPQSPFVGSPVPFNRGTIAELVRCQSETLRSFGVFGRIFENVRDLRNALAACPHLDESAVCNSSLESLGVEIQDSWNSISVGLPQDDPQLATFLSLSFVQGRVEELTVSHKLNIWQPLTTWSNLRVLELKDTLKLELPQSLCGVLAQLPKLERLTFLRVGVFVLGFHHLCGITPAVAPNLKYLMVANACETACVCAAEPHIRSAFSDTDFLCSFVCNIDNSLVNNAS